MRSAKGTAQVWFVLLILGEADRDICHSRYRRERPLASWFSREITFLPSFVFVGHPCWVGNVSGILFDASSNNVDNYRDAHIHRILGHAISLTAAWFTSCGRGLSRDARASLIIMSSSGRAAVSRVSNTRYLRTCYHPHNDKIIIVLLEASVVSASSRYSQSQIPVELPASHQVYSKQGVVLYWTHWNHIHPLYQCRLSSFSQLIMQ